METGAEKRAAAKEGGGVERGYRGSLGQGLRKGGKEGEGGGKAAADRLAEESARRLHRGSTMQIFVKTLTGKVRALGTAAAKTRGRLTLWPWRACDMATCGLWP